jgi:hypothetical protein
LAERLGERLIDPRAPEPVWHGVVDIMRFCVSPIAAG